MAGDAVWWQSTCLGCMIALGLIPITEKNERKEGRD